MNGAAAIYPVSLASFYFDRFQNIGRLFSNQKLQPEKRQRQTLEKIKNLLFILAIAFCWSYKIGVVKDAEKAIPKKTHGSPPKSLFRLGLDEDYGVP